jgi:hypothetical protein
MEQIRQLIDLTIPNKMPDGMDENCWPTFKDTVDSWAIKDSYRNKGMYAFVCWEWVIPFVEWIGKRNVLEVMCGAGWLAKALREKGINMIATDTQRWKMGARMGGRAWPDFLTPIEKASANKAIVKYGKWANIVIISWPYMDDSAYYAIKLLHKINPNALIVYIGEWGGCTANENFCDHFEAIEDDSMFNVASSKFKAWWGLHDRLELGKYKP